MPAPHPYLSYFPSELTLEVAAYLDFRDVNSLIQSARRYHSLLSDQLYKSAHALIRRDGKTPLIWAAEKGRIDSMKKLLKNDPYPRKQIRAGGGAIHFAAREGHIDAIEMLIEAGVFPDETDEDLDSPLVLATMHNQKDVVRFLLGHLTIEDGISDEYSRWDWSFAFEYAASWGLLSITRMLLEAGKNAPPQFWTRFEDQIYMALSNGILDATCQMIELLLEFSGKTFIVDHEKTPPINSAAFHGRMDAFQILLDHGADISPSSEEGASLIHMAVAGTNANEEIVQILIDHGIDLEHLDARGETALRTAVICNHLAVTRVLLEAGADTTTKNSTSNPLINETVARKGSEEMINLLHKHGALVNQTGRYGFTALHEAALSGNTDVIPLLCQLGVPMDVLDEEGDSALHIAIDNGHTGSARKLIQMGFNVTLYDDVGKMPVHSAAQSDHADALQALIDAGADPGEPEKGAGHTAMHFATWSGYMEVMEVLMKAFPEQDMKIRQALQPCSSHGKSPLQKAAMDGHNEVINLMADNGIDVTQYHGRSSALHAAVQAGQVETAQLLLDLGADPTLLDMYGRSCVDWAFLGDQTELMKLLNYHPSRLTPYEDSVSALRKSISWLAKCSLDQSRGHSYSLVMCLLYIKDFPAARVCLLLNLHLRGKTGNPNWAGICNSCSDTLIDGRFVCQTCFGLELCSQCMTEYRAHRCVPRFCWKHEFMELGEADRALWETLTDDFRIQWLRELVAKYDD